MSELFKPSEFYFTQYQYDPSAVVSNIENIIDMRVNPLFKTRDEIKNELAELLKSKFLYEIIDDRSLLNMSQETANYLNKLILDGEIKKR